MMSRRGPGPVRPGSRRICSGSDKQFHTIITPNIPLHHIGLEIMATLRNQIQKGF